MSKHSPTLQFYHPWAVATFIGLLWVNTVEANCGMDVCSMQDKGTETSHSIMPTVGLRYTTVRSNAAYVETIGGLTYKPTSSLQVGIHVPLVHTQQAGSSATGLGNVVGFVEGALLSASPSTLLNLGLQVEIPTVSQPALGDGHLLTLPTIQTGWFPKNSILMTTIGWSQVLDGTHRHATTENKVEADHHAHQYDGHHAHDTSSSAPATSDFTVNPHASSELLLRLDTGHIWRGQNHNIQVTLRMDGVQELEADDASATILNLGPTVSWMGNGVVAEVYALVPVTEKQRYRARTSLRIRLDIP